MVLQSHLNIQLILTIFRGPPKGLNVLSQVVVTCNILLWINVLKRTYQAYIIASDKLLWMNYYNSIILKCI